MKKIAYSLQITGLVALLSITQPMLRNALAQQATETATNNSKDDSKTTQNAEDNDEQSPGKKSQPSLSRYLPSPYTLEQKQQQDLAKSSKNAQWIEASSGQFLVLWSPDTSGTPYGALLILHDAGHTPQWPSTLQNLHEYLPNYGWAILSLALPSPLSPPIPPRSMPSKPDPAPSTEASQKKNNDNNEEEEPPSKKEKEIVHQEADPNAKQAMTETPKKDMMNKENMQEVKPQKTGWQRMPIEPIVAERFDAALQFLHEQGQYNIALGGEGVGAARALRLNGTAPSKEQQSAKPAMMAQHAFRALILINANEVIPETEFSFTQSLANSQLPVLDIIFHPDHAAMQLSQTRKKTAQKNNIKPYVQKKILIPETLNQTKENRLSKIVRGFLHKNAKGVEVGGP